MKSPLLPPTRRATAATRRGTSLLLALTLLTGLTVTHAQRLAPTNSPSVATNPALPAPDTVYGSGLHHSRPTLLPLPIGWGEGRGEGFSELSKGAFSNPNWYEYPVHTPRDHAGPQLSRVALISLDAKVTEETVLVRWLTANEMRTVAYDLQRLDHAGRWSTINVDPVFAWNSPTGAAYEVADAAVQLRRTQCYRVLEYMEDGSVNLHGPYVIPVGWPGAPVRITGCQTEGAKLRVSWAKTEGRFVLERSATPAADASWIPVPLPLDATDQAVVSIEGTGGFFRVFRVD